MSLFNFNDKKSEQQIARAIRNANDTRAQNAENLLAYQLKRARLTDARGEWELEEQPFLQ